MRRRESLQNLKRKRGFTPPKLRICLVCEGEKTERIYFSLFLLQLRAANVSLEIANRECGTDPVSIVEFAKKLVKNDKGIDQCYVVIDRDSHEHFDVAVNKASSFSRMLSKEKVFRLIKSYPCFEYWFILHYSYLRAPIVAAGGESAGDRAVRILKGYLDTYSKSDPKAIASLYSRMETALHNADLAYQDAESSGQYNPSTEVHLLVNALNAATV